MNEEELHALLRTADAQALRAAEQAIDIENALVAAKEAELEALLTTADAQALLAAESVIDIGKELVAAKAAAASQVVTDQATGEAQPAAVIRSLMHIVDMSETVTVTASVARRRSLRKTILMIGTFAASAILSGSVLVLHMRSDISFHGQSAITAAAEAFSGAAFGLAVMEYIHTRRIFTLNADRLRVGSKDGHDPGNPDQTIVAIAFPGQFIQRPDADTNEKRSHRDPLDSLGPRTEW